MVSAGDVVDTARVPGTGEVAVGGPVTSGIGVQGAQSEQAEVGLVPHVVESQIGGQVVVCLLVAVDAAAQQLLVLGRGVVFTAAHGLECDFAWSVISLFNQK